ncbi:FAD-dependent monooxygenase [Hyphomicrobium sp. LHD-15]|uniref:FAD-dependent monooxygenase n=1 Tax=Hyphomicrobium sp. LHD-15 TaxID=3072142 RepID=UPI00280E3930|nr:FAD-dependent monooxygenase [Hyphomicrobium sp. LHD-15]MDQ8698088.1 FAD-dependent monooxygenase [Hyphomicrobium sp. LHD-15]
MTTPTSPLVSVGSANVLIAGGGIGGLATALALAKRGFASEVLERRPAFGEDGAGIQIGPNGTRILEALGAAEFLRPHATTPDGLRIRDASSARVLATFPLGSWLAERHGAPYWAAHRRDLHSALLAAAEREPLIRIRTGVEVGAVHEQGRHVVAGTATGESLEGDALVAADGVWSRLRGRAFDGDTPDYTGKSAVRAVIAAYDVPPALQANKVQLWLGRKVHVVHYPVSAGREVALVAIFDDEHVTSDWSAPCDPAWVDARTAAFAPLLRELLAKPAQWRHWSLMGLKHAPRLAHGRIALLGDAAHPILPFLAQGGVMALEDAVVLARAFSNEPAHPERALQAYAEARAARVGRVGAASRKNGRIYHLAGPPAFARNLALRFVPAETFMRGYDWLYGWTLPE